ncbi:MAG: hypothetical protein K2X66_01885, partial [Cyanobacteria bacterium]|nr:hypothetical protein [Cyanobacteriota bacterium]
LQVELENTVYDHLINNQGQVIAQSVEDHQGQISLVAHSQTGDGLVQNTGVIDASGTSVNANGGTILVDGDNIQQDGKILAEAQSNGKGGSVTLLASNNATLSDGSLISVAGNGTNSDAGSVNVLAVNEADFQEGATISAKGGNISGNGGNVEISGKERVQYRGLTELGSVTGKSGHLLIDPTIFRFSTDASLPALLATAGSVDIWATKDIFVDKDANFSLINSTRYLGLTAGRDISVTAKLSTSGGDIKLNANSDTTGFGGAPAGSTGTLSVSTTGSVNTNGGKLTGVGNNIVIDGELKSGSLLNLNAKNNLTVSNTASFTNSAGASINLLANNHVNFDSTINTSGANVKLAANNDASGGGTLTIGANGKITPVTGSINLSGRTVNMDGTLNSNTINVTSGNSVNYGTTSSITNTAVNSTFTTNAQQNITFGGTYNGNRSVVTMNGYLAGTFPFQGAVLLDTGSSITNNGGRLNITGKTVEFDGLVSGTKFINVDADRLVQVNASSSFILPNASQVTLSSGRHLVINKGFDMNKGILNLYSDTINSGIGDITIASGTVFNLNGTVTTLRGANVSIGGQMLNSKSFRADGRENLEVTNTGKVTTQDTGSIELYSKKNVDIFGEVSTTNGNIKIAADREKETGTGDGIGNMTLGSTGLIQTTGTGAIELRGANIYLKDGGTLNASKKLDVLASNNISTQSTITAADEAVLNFKASKDIMFGSDLNLNNATVNLYADNNNSGVGTVEIQKATLTNNGGSFDIKGQNVLLGGNLLGAHKVDVNAKNNISQTGGSVSGDNGSTITMNAKNGITLDGNVSSTNGFIYLTADSDNSGAGVFRLKSNGNVSNSGFGETNINGYDIVLTGGQIHGGKNLDLTATRKIDATGTQVTAESNATTNFNAGGDILLKSGFTYNSSLGTLNINADNDYNGSGLFAIRDGASVQNTGGTINISSDTIQLDGNLSTNGFVEVPGPDVFEGPMPSGSFGPTPSGSYSPPIKMVVASGTINIIPTSTKLITIGGPTPSADIAGVKGVFDLSASELSHIHTANLNIAAGPTLMLPPVISTSYLPYTTPFSGLQGGNIQVQGDINLGLLGYNLTLQRGGDITTINNPAFTTGGHTLLMKAGHDVILTRDQGMTLDPTHHILAGHDIILTSSNPGSAMVLNNDNVAYNNILVQNLDAGDASSITINGTLDSPETITVNATGGTTIINGRVGGPFATLVSPPPIIDEAVLFEEPSPFEECLKNNMGPIL